MEKPFKYVVFDDLTNELLYQTNIEPSDYQLKNNKTVYVDTRYEAKLRLYNYVEYSRKGLPIPKYEPYKNTEIGKTIPILNF